jgi:hypothetical protein
MTPTRGSFDELFETSGDSTKMLDTVEEALDHITFMVQRPAVAALRLAVRARRNDDLGAGGANCLHKGIGVATLVDNDGGGVQLIDKLFAHEMSWGRH